MTIAILLGRKATKQTKLWFHCSDRPNHASIRQWSHIFLMVVDYATKYPEVVALPKIETERVADAFFDRFLMVGFKPKFCQSNC